MPEVINANLDIVTRREDGVIVAMFKIDGKERLVSIMSLSLAIASPESRKIWEQAVRDMVEDALSVPGVKVQYFSQADIN